MSSADGRTSVISRLWRRIPGAGGRSSDPDRRAGDAARDRGDWRAAAAHYERYLARRPRHDAVRLRLANMYKEAGDFPASQAVLDALLATKPFDPVVMRSRAELEVHRGRSDQAVLWFARAWAAGRDQPAGVALTRPETLPLLAACQTECGERFIDGGVDGLRDLAIEGWAFDASAPDQSLEIVLSANGREVARTRTGRVRGDLAALGLAPATAGFRFEVGPLLSAGLLGDGVSLQRADTGQDLAGSPLDLTSTRGLQRWAARAAPVAVPPNPDGAPILSILMPVHDVRPAWLEEALASVFAQSDGRWELICIDDGAASHEVKAILAAANQGDPRLRLRTHAASQGVAAATNRALGMARAEHVLFMDHDDRLEPDAVARLAPHLAAADLLYGDELVTGEDTADLRAIVARPAFSPRYYLSHPYFVHPVVARRDLVKAVGGLDEGLAISADVDLILRLIERTDRVAHLPGVLYRWRTHGGSAGHVRIAQTTTATIEALNRHMTRMGEPGQAVPGPVFNTYRIDRQDPGGRVRVIIPTHNGAALLRACIESLKSTAPIDDLDIVVVDHDSDEPALAAYFEELGDSVTRLPYSGPFNYSRMNNLAVAAKPPAGEFLLFLNNDIEAMEPGWLERLRALAVLPDVGAVGATLLYPDGRVQHAGVVVGPGGYAEHAFKFAPLHLNGGRNPGYNCGLVVTREWSAVTGACLMMRREVFDAVGGFDEMLPVGFNDTDLCLRLGERGLAILNDGFSLLIHHESATRRPAGEVRHPEDAARFAARWKAVIEEGDPFYSPLLSLDRDHAPEHPDVIAPRLRIRPSAGRRPHG